MSLHRPTVLCDFAIGVRGEWAKEIYRILFESNSIQKKKKHWFEFLSFFSSHMAQQSRKHLTLSHFLFFLLNYPYSMLFSLSLFGCRAFFFITPHCLFCFANSTLNDKYAVHSVCVYAKWQIDIKYFSFQKEKKIQLFVIVFENHDSHLIELTDTHPQFVHTVIFFLFFIRVVRVHLRIHSTHLYCDKLFFFYTSVFRRCCYCCCCLWCTSEVHRQIILQKLIWWLWYTRIVNETTATTDCHCQW